MIATHLWPVARHNAAAALALACLAALSASPPAAAQSNGMPAVPSIPTPPPTCDRACLTRVMDHFLDAAVVRRLSTVRLTEGAEVRENTRLVRLDGTMWRHVKAIRSRMTFIDEITSNVVSRTGVVLDGGRPAYLSTRLKVIAGERVSDIEMSSDTSTAVVASYVFALDPKFSEVLPPDQRLDRGALDALGRRYFQALSSHHPAPADFDERCNRWHSGHRVTNVADSSAAVPPLTCITSMEGDRPWGPALEQRFPVIDVERGIVLGTTLLNFPATPTIRMYASEAFKVVGGKILMIDNIGLLMSGVQTTGFQH